MAVAARENADVTATTDRVGESEACATDRNEETTAMNRAESNVEEAVPTPTPTKDRHRDSNGDAKNDEEDASPVASAAFFYAGEDLKPIAFVPRLPRGEPTFEPTPGADRSERSHASIREKTAVTPASGANGPEWTALECLSLGYESAVLATEAAIFPVSPTATMAGPTPVQGDAAAAADAKERSEKKAGADEDSVLKEEKSEREENEPAPAKEAMPTPVAPEQQDFNSFVFDLLAEGYEAVVSATEATVFPHSRPKANPAAKPPKKKKEEPSADTNKKAAKSNKKLDKASSELKELKEKSPAKKMGPLLQHGPNRGAPDKKTLCGASTVSGGSSGRSSSELRLENIQKTRAFLEAVRALETKALLNDIARNQAKSAAASPLVPLLESARFDYYRLVVADGAVVESDMMVRLPGGVHHTFADLRLQVEEDGLGSKLPFASFRFAVDPDGEAGVHRRQEGKWRVRDFSMDGTDSRDGSCRHPYRVYVKEDEE